MSIKPIDLQTNMNQMHDIAKSENIRSSTIGGLQHVLEKESDEQSKMTKSRLEENQKAEKSIILKEEKGWKKRWRGGKDRKKKEGENNGDRPIHDDRMGNIIDVKK
jgi:hypothetical protein